MKNFRKKRSLGYRLFCAFIAWSFMLNVVIAPQGVYAQSAVLNLPPTGTMVTSTPAFQPVAIQGLMLYPDNPFKFDFIMNKGDVSLSDEAFKNESSKLIKYFLASLTIPEKEMWVNLSPYEKDRIIPNGFGQTQMGTDLLAQDYMLKQLTASLMYPENELGSEFWKQVYQKAQDKYGTTDIPMNTFNKVWIVPEKASIYENEKGAFIVDSRLKVLLEEDYLALDANKNSTEHGLGNVAKEDLKVVSGVQSEVIREIIIPALEKEVNEGKTFANLRQIYQSMILGSWYKRALKESLLSEVYANKEKTKGVDLEDKAVNQKIYDQYVAAFKKGVYDYLKDEYDPAAQQVISKKYFSGGVNVGDLAMVSDVVDQTAALNKARTIQSDVVTANLAGLNANGGITSMADAATLSGPGFEKNLTLIPAEQIQTWSSRAENFPVSEVIIKGNFSLPEITIQAKVISECRESSKRYQI